jgi:hypothetical protein
LAACEQLIGHEFNNLDLLKQALDSRGSLSRRLAILGDRAVENHLAHRWWEKKDLSSLQWNELRASVLCNENLSKVGFRMGISECTIPDSCGTDMKTRMATTIEAVLAAVWLDTNCDAAAFEKVINRLGLTHPLLDAGTRRAWLHGPITSSRRLPRCFFSGHHILLVRALSELEQSMNPPRGSASESARLIVGEASPKQETEPKRSEAQKIASPDSRTEVEQLYMEIEKDTMSQLSRQVLPSKQPSPKVPSDDDKHPGANRSIERAKDDAIQTRLPGEQGAENLASSGMDARKSKEDAKPQKVHDEGPLFRAKGPKVEETTVERDSPGDAKSDPNRMRKLRVQELEPCAHRSTGTGGGINSEEGSRKDVAVYQGQQPSEGNPTEDASAQDDEAAREQQIRVLEMRMQRLSKRQSANPNQARLEALDELIARIQALKENTVEAVLVDASTDSEKQSVDSHMASTETDVCKTNK